MTGKPLLLIPTQFELDRIGPAELQTITQLGWQVELCGFGPIAAAATSSRHLAVHKSPVVLLLGIAGSYQPDVLPVGSATSFEKVSCHGIGVGGEAEFQSASELGWNQIETPNLRVGDSMPLNHVSPSAGELLTCMTSASSIEQAKSRAMRFPAARAEDMEGFGVAMACAIAAVPCTIVRGISNVAGDRDKASWAVDDAMQSAVQLAIKILQSGEVT